MTVNVRCMATGRRSERPPMNTPSITLDDAERALPLLEENGYLLVRDVLPPEQVERARARCDSYLLADEDAENEIEANALLRMPEMNFIFDERVVRALRTWMGGSLVYYPNYIARLNRRTGWHVDNGFSPLFLPDASHVYDPGFRHVQCVVYLQDNRPGPGGGLDVRPGSHRWAATGDVPEDDHLTRTYPDVVSLDSRAGDLIVFDGRLMHRGTPQDGSATHRKYGVFWSASREDRRQRDRYIEYFQDRVDYLRTRNLPSEEFRRDVERHRLMGEVRFPDSYLPEAVEILRRHSVTPAELPRAAVR
ncbi:phytanoyl-CoA dioxygenase family protein [Micromonospora sp. NPDC092111]|uniref:phytanoyl-CoA dioxygenase family protein n=1 Tax=Micromonospora sp. NPDC092111 TaxID=3364289 RepID=UPI0038175014